MKTSLARPRRALILAAAVLLALSSCTIIMDTPHSVWVSSQGISFDVELVFPEGYRVGSWTIYMSSFDPDAEGPITSEETVPVEGDSFTFVVEYEGSEVTVNGKFVAYPACVGEILYLGERVGWTAKPGT